MAACSAHSREYFTFNWTFVHCHFKSNILRLETIRVDDQNVIQNI